MSAELDLLAKYIQAIALDSPEIKKRLSQLEARGTLQGIGVHANISDDQEGCCTPPEDQGGDNYEPPGDHDGPPEDHPDCAWGSDMPLEQYYNVCQPEDCETGEPIDFSPQGFTEPERCKECGPDPNWEPGSYWSGASINSPCFEKITVIGASLAGAAGQAPSTLCGTCAGGECLEYVQKAGVQQVSETAAYIQYTRESGQLANYVYITRRVCTADASEYCDIDEPPEICGDDWTQDGAAQLTIRNGCIVASKCDPDANPSDLSCNECKDLCLNGRKWRFCATADGGWVQYDPTGRNPGGKYRPDGSRKDVIQPGQEAAYL